MRSILVAAVCVMFSLGCGPEREPVKTGDGTGEGEAEGFTDAVGDVDETFIDIVRAGMQSDDETLTWWVEVQLLTDLNFQQTELAPGTLEYAWNVYGDVVGDDGYDLFASITAYHIGAAPYASPLGEAFVSSGLFTDAAQPIDDVPFEVDGNRISFVIPRNLHPALADIGDDIPMRATTPVTVPDGIHSDQAESPR
jgi:hypothetical protein